MGIQPTVRAFKRWRRALVHKHARSQRQVAKGQMAIPES